MDVGGYGRLVILVWLIACAIILYTVIELRSSVAHNLPLIVLGIVPVAFDGMGSVECGFTVI